MDFFDRQHQTKKNTARLVFYFILAVLFVSLLNHLTISLSILVLGLFSVSEESSHDVGDVIEFGLSFLMDLRFIGLVTFFTFCLPFVYPSASTWLGVSTAVKYKKLRKDLSNAGF